MVKAKILQENELARLLKNESREAYRELFERFAPEVFNFALSYLKSEVESEGLVQDVFLKIWEKRQTIDTEKNLKSYIFKIAVNTIYDLLRKKNLEHAFNDFLRLNYIPGEESTWQRVIFDDLQARLNETVAQLPARQQEIFRMNKEEGLSNDEIAIKLKVSKRTVENQLYRALTFLKENFRKISPAAFLFIYIYCS